MFAMKKYLKYLTTIICLVFTHPGFAEQLWSEYALIANHGNAYLNPFDNYKYSAELVTVERASGHDWGSTFSFVDVVFNSSDNSPTDIYTETGATYNIATNGEGLVKGIYIAGQIEYGYQYRSMTNTLAGIGVDLNIPTASFFSVTAYKRNNDPLGIALQNNEQLTLVWRFDWDKVRFDGFCDITTSSNILQGSEKSAGGYQCRPQLTYDISTQFNLHEQRVGVGFKYVIWTNKFGVSGFDEKNLNAMVIFNF
jgi:hypothetical protein